MSDDWQAALAEEVLFWHELSGVPDAVPLSTEIDFESRTISVESVSKGRMVIGRLSPAWRLVGVTETQLAEAMEKLALPSRRSAEKRGKRPAELRAEIARRRHRGDTNETIAADLGISERYVYELMKKPKS